MYAVTFDLNTNYLTNEYNDHSNTNARGDIRKFMEAINF